MIYLHRILPLFLLPIGLVLVLLVGGLLLRRRWLCWLGMAFLWLAGMPLVGNLTMRATERWQVRRPATAVPETSAIVVLSGGLVQPPGAATYEWNDAVDRYCAGLELFRVGKAPLLIFTGGWVPWRPGLRPEGEVLIEYALAAGIPRHALRTTETVVNTAAEARAVAALLEEEGAAPRVILVTSAFHLPRAALIFARAGLEVAPFPVDFRVSTGQRFTVLDVLPSALGLRNTEIALREFYGLAFYWVFG